MDRLLKKHRTARKFIPPAVLTKAPEPTRLGAIYFGSTSAPMTEADEILTEEQGVTLDLLRLRGFPFGEEVEAFIAEHDKVFVVEQNRDGQMRSLLINELEIDPKKLVKILHYDGTPITARFIAGAIGDRLEADKIVPLRKAAS
jgi:2-oxoglutarate ferredoxin oxidoreductase subunit alpha